MSDDAAHDAAVALVPDEMAPAEAAETTPVTGEVDKELLAEVAAPEKPEAPVAPPTKTAERIARQVERDKRTMARELASKDMESKATALYEQNKKDREEIDELIRDLQDPTKRIQTLEKKFGVTYDAYTEAVLKGGKRTAEDIASAADKRVADLEARLAAKDDESRRTQYESAVARELAGAVAHVEAQAEKYPTLYAEYDTKQIEAGIRSTWSQVAAHNQQLAKQGKPPEIYSDEEVAQYLESEAKKLYDAKLSRRQRVSPQQSSGTNGASRPAGKVISSELSGTSSSGREETDEDRRERALKLLG